MKAIIFSLCLCFILVGCAGNKPAALAENDACEKTCSMQCRTGTLVTSPVTLEATHVPDYTPIGACLHVNGYCELDSQEHCQLVGGMYQGDGVQCPTIK